MGALKLTYHESQTAISENWKIFVRGIEKNASSQNFCKDYFTGGSIMPGRSFSSNSYRFGYNAGSEKDDEITGVTGSHITTYYREGALRESFWWSPDPKPHPSWSPYAMMDCNPIKFNDPRGDWIPIKFKGGKKTKKEFHKVQETFRNEYGIELNIEKRKLFGYKLSYNKEASDKLYNDKTKTTSSSGLLVSESARNEWINALNPDKKAKTDYDDGRANRTLRLTFGNNTNWNSPGLGNMYTGRAYIDLSYFNKNSNLNWDTDLPSFAKRTTNLARVMEHEFLGHAKRGWDDYYKSSIGGFEKRTTLSLVNSFRVEMGLQDFQRMFYRLENRGMSFFSNPNDNFSKIYSIGK